MRAVDTNIIIRFLVKDDPEQCLAVKKMFEKIEKSGDKLWVSNVVILEMMWVLRSRYTASRDETLTAVKTLFLKGQVMWERKQDLRLHSQEEKYPFPSSWQLINPFQ
ncbi:MAG TPA: type II toxin-antitoxin system VapC family toxin [Thermoplasmata archaeon]|nr:type II toxin-antitoxin system VapC family toxin [Thermoplasmata archaeon]